MLNNRKGCMLSMAQTSGGQTVIQYEVPSRGMNGIKSRLLTASKGLVVMSTTFAGYKKYAGDFGAREQGSLIATEQGTASAFAIDNAQERGTLFSKPGDP